MTLRNAPVFASTAFSAALHLALVPALLQLPAVPAPAGDSLRIELLRSLATSGQTDTATTEPVTRLPQAPAAARMPSSGDSLHDRSVASGPAPPVTEAKPRAALRQAALTGGDRTDGTDTHTAANDTDTRTDAMLELLHEEISHHKRYPYLARRQHREGTARVEFVLYPDGRIDNAALLESSRSPALDRAAVTAIEETAPFVPATQYLSRARTFRIDVVFRLE